MNDFTRTDRALDALRPITLTTHIARYAEGSCQIHVGNSVVRCTASAENRVPHFLKGKNQGWLTAEYAMLPRATQQRTDRKSMLEGGRTKEIQRLIGRSLRSACDFNAFPDWQIRIDCDVIEADGGTRTAAINGAFIAMTLCFAKMYQEKHIKSLPIKHYIAAISCGIVNGQARLDLQYEEDMIADTDANFVMDQQQRFIEIQGTAEAQPFDNDQLDEMLKLARKGIAEIITLQQECLAEYLPANITIG